MIIDPIVLRLAQHYGLDPTAIQSIKLAEGNIVKAVQFTVPTADMEVAINVTCRSFAHAMMKYILADNERCREVIKIMGSKWAPIGAENDPHHLNENWVPNVLKLWGKQ